jgi:hypothetical protein
MYQLRGQRVEALSDEHIRRAAMAFCNYFEMKSKRGRKKRYDDSLERLSIYGITINPVDDAEWSAALHGRILGHYDPSTATISVPEHIYLDACSGDRFALSVVLHEIGHMILGHQPVLHFATGPATQNEDAEWQADAFADHALNFLGYDSIQLSLEFY